MSADNNPHEGHRKRLRLRFETEGLESFAPHEALELLLFYAIPRGDTNVLAHRLIERFGSLDRVLDADASELTSVDGVGSNTAALLRLIPAFSQYYVRERFDKTVSIKNSEQMGSFICSRIGFINREVLAAVAFDSRRNEIAFEIIDRGFSTEAPVKLRSLVEFAVRHNAAMIVIAHNHVLGAPTPSQADRDTTRRICTAMCEVGIPVCDHIIVSGENYFSFAANGILPV